MKPGLETIARVCKALGDPQRKFKAVHIAGTNGKGAVSAIIDSALRAAKIGCVARYTSPHLVKVNERFLIDGALASDGQMLAATKHLEAALANESAELTYFEMLTAIAFTMFAEKGVDYAVLECGLGGRLDATNICKPALSVITNVGLDHCDWLGDTTEKVAQEKAGIIKRGIPVLLARNCGTVRDVIAARARELDAPFYYAPDMADYLEIPQGFSLGGGFNRENAVTALAALKVLSQTDAGFGSQVMEKFKDGFSNVVWPGRFHEVGSFIIDGAHNVPAAAALVKALQGRPKVNLIAGFCADKNVDEVLAILAPVIRSACAVKTNNPRSLTAAETAMKMRSAGIAAIECDTLSAALRQAKDCECQTLICGSLFLAGEALVELGAYPWSTDIRFDLAETLSAQQS
jgi:dihydrofolate synthase/folylpolyglutamate synthase